MGNNVKLSNEQLKNLGLETCNRFLITDADTLNNIESMDQSDIEKDSMKVEDRKEIQEIVDFRRENDNELPKGIIYKKMQKSNGIIFDEYYYENIYNYYKVEYLTETDIEFHLKVKNALSQQSIATSLFFFRVLAIVSIFATIIMVIIAVSST